MGSADQDIGIGRRVQAARERLGWSREALAFHAGISWSAIRQLESGRRRNLRPRTLAALAGALGVTVDYLVCGGALSTVMLDHRALIYESDAELLSIAVPFLGEAAERSEAALAVTTPAHCELLGDHLGPAAGVEFADHGAWCDRPGAALGRLRAFVNAHLEAGTSWIRILVEPVASERTAAEAPLWAEYEALLNLVFRSAPLAVVCAYDAATLADDVRAQIDTTHPQTVGNEGPVANADYVDPVEFVLEPTALSDPERFRRP